MAKSSTKSRQGNPPDGGGRCFRKTSHRLEENIKKAQMIHKLGGSGVMQWQDWPVPDKVRLRHTAVDVTHADTFCRADISHPRAVPEPQTINGPS